jgi:hypothetical protein
MGVRAACGEGEGGRRGWKGLRETANFLEPFIVCFFVALHRFWTYTYCQTDSPIFELDPKPKP